MKERITAAVIGSGYMGKKYLAILNELVDEVIICSKDEETARSLADEYGTKFYTNYIEMFEKEKTDFVCICLPTHLHYDAAMYAMEHNVNILCEKPFASSVEQVKRMFETANEKGILLMVGHCRRFSRGYEYLKRCIKDQRFGRLMYLNLYSHSSKPLWSVGNWLADMNLSGGVVVDFHIHDTDMVVNMLGTPQAVYTTGNDYVSNTTYKFANSTAITSSASWRSAKEYPFGSGYDAVFENACLKLHISDDNGEAVYKDNSEKNMLIAENFSEFYDSNNLVENEIKYFIHCLLDDLQPELCSPLDSLKTMYINQAEIESMKTGNMVVVNY